MHCHSLMGLLAGAAFVTCGFAGTADAQETPLQYGEPTGQAWMELPKVNPTPIRPNKAGVYGLEHTHAIVKDLEKSLHFYVDIMGFDQVMAIQDIGKDPPMNERMNVLLG